MRAGALDRQITIQRQAVPDDAEYVAPDSNYGTKKVVWVPLSKLSDGTAEKFAAEVSDFLSARTAGTETVAFGSAIARNATRIRLRYRDDIDSTMRLLLHGDGEDSVYQIVGGPANVASEGRKTLIEILCEKYSE